MNDRIINVHMLAFHETSEQKVRPVKIIHGPTMTNDDILNAVWRNGQNEVQNVPRTCSVSIGDVVELPDKSLHRIATEGFRPMTAEQFEKYKALPRFERSRYDFNVNEL